MRRGAAHRLRVLTAAALCVAAGLFTTTTSAQSPAILSVPYLPQSEALCGGASAAMVMRYWGDRDVYADAFAPLVDKSAGGIHTSALVNELERRHWTVVAGAGDLSQLTQEIGRGRPVIALIEDRPGRFHYVVVVSTIQDKILFHDPARAPSRAADAKTFDAKWAKAGRWMAIVLPAQNPASGRDTSAAPVVDVNASPSSSSPEPCANEVVQGLDLAGRGEKERARRVFEEASVTCPASAAPWRELAGLDAVEAKWDAAAQHARQAVAIDPADAHAWRVLATAEYLLHHDLEALAAWNRVGEPRTDLMDISGLGNTRYMVIADAVGVRPKELLTPGALRLAQRRVRDVPAIAAARVAFRPAENGRAQIDVSVVERDRVPATYASWVGIGIGAVTERQLAASFANVTGGGDVVTASWRWWAHRPMIAASYAAPAPRALGGVWRLDASRETQTFGPSAFEETRTRVGFEMSNWIRERMRLAGGTALERFTSRGPGDNVAINRPRAAVLSGRVEYWPVVDRIALEAGGSTWQGARESFGAFGAAIRGRTTTESTGTVWLANAGYRAVTPSSPASIWPGADTGHARDVLLRAHPLLDDGIITDAVFGRRLAFGGGEVQQWLSPGKWPLRLAPAAFVDVARATRGLQTTIDRAQIDAGVGLRLSVLGMGVMRIDLAHGLRDGRTAFSVGWTSAGR